MSREIKFRLRNNTTGEFIIVSLGDHALCMIGARDSYSLCGQYTRLKDKNGKEIYEGDIVRDIYPAGYSTYQVKFGEYDNGEEYEDNDSGYGWYLESIYESIYIRTRRNTKTETGITQYPDARNMIVIGNIYENPELLEE